MSRYPARPSYSFHLVAASHKCTETCREDSQIIREIEPRFLDEMMGSQAPLPIPIGLESATSLEPGLWPYT